MLQPVLRPKMNHASARVPNARIVSPMTLGHFAAIKNSHFRF